MRLVHAGQAFAIAMALLSAPFTGMSAEAAVVADAPEQLQAKLTAALVARHSGKCLDVKDNSTLDGANVVQWTCNNQNNQKWNLVATDNGYYTTRATHSGKCLDVKDNSKQDGANVVQWTCNNQYNQQWRLVQKDNGYFTLVARHSGKCLDVSGASTLDGANVVQWTCLPNQRNQEWRLS